MKPQHDSNQDPYSAPQVYYGTTFASERKGRINTYSINLQRSLVGGEWDESGYRPKYTHARRGSYDETMLGGRKFLVNVDTALEKLRMQEDTDGNLQITIEDKGPKVFSLGTASSNGFRRADIRGTYQLSNLLQELLFAKEYGRRQIILDEARLNENPINRIYRLIKDSFWPELTRDMSEAGIETAFGSDNEDSASPLQRRIYVPRSAPEQYDFYGHLSQRRPELGISVEWIENNITPEYVKSIKERPGLLALATADPEQDRNAKEGIKFLPYITSGRKRDQFHGWDSYFNVLGLLSHEEIKLALSLVEHFCFCIKHYGHVPQGNRSYYLTRSSPPFLTDMALRVYNKIKHEEYALAFLRRALLACIKEYHAVWMMPPRFDPITNLSRYRTGGAGIPTDLQVDLAEQLKSYATKYGMSLDAFTDAYNAGVVEDGDLYTFLMHERAMQESGHSFSSRFRGRCANLVTIDLNSLLYKYEKDIAQTIKLHFADRFEVPADICVGNMPAGGYIDRSTLWERRARRRKLAIDRYLWNEGKKMYFDYDTVKREQSTSESATAFWPLWAGLASPAQAQQLVSNAIPRFEATGGISATTEESRGLEASERQNVQWDYPYGWAPHQVLLWSGLAMYGYQDVAERLAYKWLFAIIKSFVDYSGVIEESYDVTRVMDPQRRSIGRDHQFLKGVLKDRSTWVSASFVCGLQIANQHQIRCLGAMVPWDTYCYEMTRWEQSNLDSESEFPVDETVTEASRKSQEIASNLTILKSLQSQSEHRKMSIKVTKRIIARFRLKQVPSDNGIVPFRKDDAKVIGNYTYPATQNSVEKVPPAIRIQPASDRLNRDLLGRSPWRRRSVSSVDLGLPLDISKTLGNTQSNSRLTRSERRFSISFLPRSGSVTDDLEEEATKSDAFHVSFKDTENLPFQHVKLLGHGAYGVVEEVSYAGISTRSSRTFARKVILVIKGRGAGVLESFRQEASINRRLRHKHITSLLWTYEVLTAKGSVREVGMVITPVAQLNLAEFLELCEADERREADTEISNQGHRLACLERWYGCLANAMTYIHAQRIRHKDIKPTNILVKDDNILIADFGLSKRFSDETTETRSTAGFKTPGYCAPEVAAHEPRSRASDIFSLGCVFAEMTTVLAGEKLCTFEEMRGPPGARAFQLTLNSVLTWLLHLARRLRSHRGSLHPPVEPVRWTWLMLNPKKERRISADGLSATIMSVRSMSMQYCECEASKKFISLPGSSGKLETVDSNPSWLGVLPRDGGSTSEPVQLSWG